MKIAQLDLARYTTSVIEEWLPLVREITLSGKILNGPYKKKFEEEFAKYIGVKYALGVASGTDALKLSFQALGIGKGDEIITHANAFTADIESILGVGATPVLIDMSEHDYGPDLESLKRAITSKTKAILVVHLCGLPADLDPILKIAKVIGVPVVEDVAQAQGALYKNKQVGGFGKINAFSLGPVKNLAGLGDAGCIVTDDAELYEKVTLLGVHGQAKKYEHVVYGWNSRLDELQAAWLLLGLKTLDARNNRRQEVYGAYKKGFEGLPLRCMPDKSDRTNIFHQAIIETGEREALQKFLQEKEIGTGIYYPYALHEQAAWKSHGFPAGSFRRAEKYARENLSLPIFAELKDEEVAYVVENVKSFFKK